MNNPRSPPPSFFQPMHRHAEWRLIVFLSGKTTEETFGGARTYRAGDFMFRPAYFAHADRTGSQGGTYACLPVTQRALRQHFSTRGWRALKGNVDLVALGSEGRRVCGGGDDLLPLLNEKAYEPYARSQTSRIASEVANESASLAVLAERNGFRPYQFTRWFIRAFGVSPRTYRKQARVQRAIEAIAESGATLAQIAADAGFHDQSHLTRTLTLVTLRTPGQLRRCLQPG